MSAVVAAAAGVAQLVAQTVGEGGQGWTAQAVLTMADVMLQPGVTMSVFRRPSAVGPGFPSPTVPSFGSRSDAFTPMAFFAVPGGPCSSPLLPIEPSTR